MHEQLSLLIERFRFLHHRYRRPRRGRTPESERINYACSQTELFQLAQAIADRYIQERLNHARAAIMRVVHEQSLHDGPIVIRPKRLNRPVRWDEIMLTPELETDLRLTGIRIPLGLVQALRTAHAAQIFDVREKVGI